MDISSCAVTVNKTVPGDKNMHLVADWITCTVSNLKEADDHIPMFTCHLRRLQVWVHFNP